MVPTTQHAPKARVSSEVSLVEGHPMTLEKQSVSLLEGHPLVVLLFCFYISNHASNIGLADGKQGIALGFWSRRSDEGAGWPRIAAQIITSCAVVVVTRFQR
jgi:hypothetical protein